MLTIFGKPARTCDGVSRRDFMKIGGLGIAGLSLPEILRAEAITGKRNPQKAVIMIHLGGGASHQDMFDMKPDAPDGIRGDFRPINSNVSGIQVCEHMPRLAKIMDKVAIVRSLTDSEGLHDIFQCATGKLTKNMPPGGWPTVGSCVAKLLGDAKPGVPPFVKITSQTYSTFAPECGFLGSGSSPFSPLNEGRADLTLNRITLDRLSDRHALLKSLDRFRRDADSSRTMAGMDAFEHQAMDVLTSSKLADALDITKESMKVRDRYGAEGQPGTYRSQMREGEPFLLARRLVEAGARFVNMAWGGWDTHTDNFKTLRAQLPVLDHHLSALVEDLYDRGLGNDVSVCMWGEFGRNPKVNPAGGRDHWPKVNQCFLAGGGMKTGQAIGTTDRTGGEVDSRPLLFGEVIATLYQNLGIDVSKATVSDLGGRPHYLVDGCSPIKELVG